MTKDGDALSPSAVTHSDESGKIKPWRKLLLSPAFKHCILLIHPVALTAITDVVFHFFHYKHLFFFSTSKSVRCFLKHCILKVHSA